MWFVNGGHCFCNGCGLYSGCGVLRVFDIFVCFSINYLWWVWFMGVVNPSHRLKQEHSRELEGLRNQYQLELKEEREELEREKDRKISLAREQHKAEYELEKGRLDRQHREMVESMGRSLRAEQEEEARLHEGKEDALKAIKRKVGKGTTCVGGGMGMGMGLWYGNGNETVVWEWGYSI